MNQTSPKHTLTLEIESLAHGPYGVGRHEGRVVMVPGTVPGDRVTARVVESKDRYAIAALAEVIRPSSQRRQPPCPYVGTCGGCQWQQIGYAAQLAAKQRSVEDALRRIGRLTDFESLPIVAAAREFHYRRRIRLHSDANRKLGFLRPASDDVVEIAACEIAAEAVNHNLEYVRRLMGQVKTNVTEIEIVAGDGANELVLVVFAAGPIAGPDNEIFGKAVSGATGISGLIVTGGGRRRVWGDARVTIVAQPGIRQHVQADVFTQINADGNRTILGHLLRAGEFENSDRVLELYCGAGNFTLSLAGRVREVVAVEGHRPAVDCARLDAAQNGIENIRWEVAPVPSYLTNLARRRERFDKIVLDPPRAGAKGLDRDLAALDAGTILYVSCNPATLARDAAALVKRGYKLHTVQPIDLFPQTFHVETLAVIKRR